MKYEKISLGVDVWERVNKSPIFQQIRILFTQLFKRNFGFNDIGISQEEWKRIRIQDKEKLPPFSFCPLIWGTEEGRRRCSAGTLQISERISATGEADVFPCHAGLTDITVPIMFNNKYCGCLTLEGGVLLQGPSEEEFNEIVVKVKDTGVDVVKLREAYFDITPISRETIDLILKVFGAIIEEIIRIAVVSEEDDKKIARLESALFAKYNFANIIGKSKAIRQIFQLLEQIKDSDISVLIEGETGTGKELVAQTIQYNSPRRDKPFLTQNCSALNESLLESELFGYVKGAFTGAVKDKKGLFELADGGTLFLDEVADMSHGMQSKLLRVIEQGEFRKLGDERVTKVNVRIMSATNHVLQELVKSGIFREDLFYRLKGITITLPPLRTRREDIPLLVNYFLEKNNKDMGKKVNINNDALKLLCDYDWPGNVRELENEINRAVTLASNEIIPDILSKEIRNPVQTGKGNILERFKGKSIRIITEEVEKELIVDALNQAKGNKASAAKILDIPRTTLMNKIKSYGIEK